MMKKWLLFLFGIIVGIVLTLTIVYIVNSENNTIDSEYDTPIPEVEDSLGLDNMPTNIDEEIPGEIINEKSFKVFQVMNQIVALVNGRDEYGYYTGTVYLLKNNEWDLYTKKVSPFYDDQIINVPKGKVVRMFGTYQYLTRNGNVKTVPIIRIVDK